MSGGTFNYAHEHVTEFASDLSDWIFSPQDCARATNPYNDSSISVSYRLEFFKGLKPVTQEVLRDLQAEAAILAQKMKAVDWFISGDTTEASFLSEVVQIETSRFVK